MVRRWSPGAQPRPGTASYVGHRDLSGGSADPAIGSADRWRANRAAQMKVAAATGRLARPGGVVIELPPGNVPPRHLRACPAGAMVIELPQGNVPPRHLRACPAGAMVTELQATAAGSLLTTAPAGQAGRWRGGCRGACSSLTTAPGRASRPVAGASCVQQRRQRFGSAAHRKRFPAQGANRSASVYVVRPFVKPSTSPPTANSPGNSPNWSARSAPTIKPSARWWPRSANSCSPPPRRGRRPIGFHAAKEEV